MQIRGRRIQIAGSASRDASKELVRYAHELIREIVVAIADEGGTFVLGIGREPLTDGSSTEKLPIVFYWTALAAIGEAVERGAIPADGVQGRLITVVETLKTEEQVPDARRGVWAHLRNAGAVDMEFTPSGWTSGAMRRVRQAERGDILIVLSGGEGVEHLAEEYVRVGKPVIPLDLDVGASTERGPGRAARLFPQILAHPETFLRVSDSGAAGDLLDRCRTHQGKRSAAEVAKAVVSLIRTLDSPTVFYVRLLNPEIEQYHAVERFFRRVVDPVIDRLGYKHIEMGRDKAKSAWLDEAIFESIHDCTIAVVDLTALRNDCLIEFGYVLGRGKSLMLTAQRKTPLPFDVRALDCHFWDDSADEPARIADFEMYWRRSVNRPPLVKPREIV